MPEAEGYGARDEPSKLRPPGRPALTDPTADHRPRVDSAKARRTGQLNPTQIVDPESCKLNTEFMS